MARPRNFDETQVLEHAVNVFRERGYEGTSVPQLTDRLGICRQSLYNTFGDKRGLFLQALERYGEREVESKLAFLASEGSPLDHLRTLIRGVAAKAVECSGGGCLSVTAMVEARDDPEVLEMAGRQVAALEQGFIDTLQRAQDLGELKPDVKPERLGRALTTAFYGLDLLHRLPGSGQRIGDTVAELLSRLDAAATTQ